MFLLSWDRDPLCHYIIKMKKKKGLILLTDSLCLTSSSGLFAWSFMTNVWVVAEVCGVAGLTLINTITLCWSWERRDPQLHGDCLEEPGRAGLVVTQSGDTPLPPSLSLLTLILNNFQPLLQTLPFHNSTIRNGQLLNWPKNWFI